MIPQLPSLNLEGTVDFYTRKLAKLLNQKKDLMVTMVHTSNHDWEKKQYALFEAKKRFYVQHNAKTTLTFEDTVAVESISRLDSAFTQYLVKQSGITTASTPEDMAIKIVGEQNIQALVEKIERERKENVLKYLASKVEGALRYHIVDAKATDLTGYRERPKFVLLYEGAPSNTVAAR
jgi:hypothetical protein